jgi:hypothetical protein
VPEETFYATAAQVAFALLGLWWVVVAERFREWREIPSRRRQAYTVSLYFMLAGVMSLGSLISDDPTVWRLTFGIAGGLGLLEALAALAAARTDRAGVRQIVLFAASILAYAAIVAVALRAKLAQDVGLGLKPLESEALAVSILLFIGVNVAWALFLEGPRGEGAGRP